MIKKVPIHDAAGMTLGHDLTRGAETLFRRGWVLRREDIPAALDSGKAHVYVMTDGEADVNEEDAAYRLSDAFAGAGFRRSDIKEGRIDFIAAARGVLKVNMSLLGEINAAGRVVLATRHTGTVCELDMVVAGAKIIPLYIPDAGLRTVENLCREKGPVLKLLPFVLKRAGVVVVGTEFFRGEAEEKFTELIWRKMEALGAQVIHSVIVPDDERQIADAVIDMKTRGAEIIFACGGFGVDPDDVTTEAVELAGAEIVSYGAPVMPGSSCLVAYLDGVPVLGAPTCALWNKATVMDVFLPRMLAEDRIMRDEVAALGHGGLCLSCQPCKYPLCPFCK
ncbi:MAG: molybdopterin-binding protein [Dehalococcoidia bacterium]|nr:molybdopterin-binding protein [Dehalococcoidia bacterium]